MSTPQRSFRQGREVLNAFRDFLWQVVQSGDLCLCCLGSLFQRDLEGYAGYIRRQYNNPVLKPCVFGGCDDCPGSGREIPVDFAGWFPPLCPNREYFALLEELHDNGNQTEIRGGVLDGDPFSRLAPFCWEQAGDLQNLSILMDNKVPKQEEPLGSRQPWCPSPMQPPSVRG